MTGKNYSGFKSGKVICKEIAFGDKAVSKGPVIFYGTNTTRAAVLAEVDSSCAVGSLYVSTAGKLYIKVNTAGAATDWQKVTSTAAD